MPSLASIDTALTQAKESLHLAHHQDDLGGHKRIRYWSSEVRRLEAERKKLLKGAYL